MEHFVTILTMAAFIIFYSFLYGPKIAIVVAISIFFHELGHIFALKKLKYKVEGFYFTPVGGVVIYNKPQNTKDSVIINLAGPFFGVLVGFISLLLGLVYKESVYFYQASMVFGLNAFNLFPINGLDGGNALMMAVKSFGKKASVFYSVAAYLFSLGAALLAVFMPEINKSGVIIMTLLSMISCYQMIKEIMHYSTPQDYIENNMSKKQSIFTLLIVPIAIIIFFALSYFSFLGIKS